jgi:regulator of sirC expression with transglutaminase-like and TPR domain
MNASFGAERMNRPLSTPAYCRPPAYAAFAHELPRIETTRGLFRAAFAIAQHDRPNHQVQQAESIVETLAETVRRRVRSTNTQARLAHLHDVLFEVVGLRGNVDDYYDPANSYLPDVLRTRRGLPIALVLIYKCVAEGVGLTVHGINAPGHFLAAVDGAYGQRASSDSPPWMYVDPFYGGELLDEHDIHRRIVATTGQEIPPSPQWLARATGRQWLSRMLMNLQAAFASLGRERDLLAMQELQALLDDSAPPPTGRVQ